MAALWPSVESTVVLKAAVEIAEPLGIVRVLKVLDTPFDTEPPFPLLLISKLTEEVVDAVVGRLSASILPGAISGLKDVFVKGALSSNTDSEKRRDEADCPETIRDDPETPLDVWIKRVKNVVIVISLLTITPFWQSRALNV
jgi:hypothetical protein